MPQFAILGPLDPLFSYAKEPGGGNLAYAHATAFKSCMDGFEG